MTVNLDNINFTNDFFIFDIPDNRIMVLNTLQEEMKSSSNVLSNLNVINIEVSSDEGYYPCSNVIGLGNKFFKIETDHKEYRGKQLSKDNMKYCRIVVYD